VFNTVLQRATTIAFALVAIVAGISWYQADPATRSALVSGVGKGFAWFAAVALLPFATFFLIGRVAKTGTNSAGAVLVAGYTLLAFLLLGLLFGFADHGKTAWVFITTGTLFAAVYNLFICDWLAEKLE
jgi:hypothetical protein